MEPSLTAVLDDAPMVKKKLRPGRPKSPESKLGRFAFRAHTDWLDWLDRFATFRRKEKAQLVDEALEELARIHKFEKPPRR